MVISGVADRVPEKVASRSVLGSVGVDPAGIGSLIDALAEIDVSEDYKNLVGIGQGYRLMNSIKTVERKLVDGTLWHSGSGLMSWCVSNLKIEATATSIRATKASAGDAKIDCAMALFDAAG